MSLFKDNNFEKTWKEKWNKPLTTIRDNFQESVSNDPTLKNIKKNKTDRLIKRNSGITIASILGAFLSNDILYYSFLYSNPVFAESFLIMDTGIDYVFAFIAAICSGGIFSIFIDKYYSRKIPKEEKTIVNKMKSQINKEKGELLYTTYNAHSHIKNLFTKIRNNPSIVYIIKSNYKKNSYSLVSKNKFFKTLNNILENKTRNEDYYIFCYGIEDVKLNLKDKKLISERIS
jgi:hypothetical protein